MVSIVTAKLAHFRETIRLWASIYLFEPSLYILGIISKSSKYLLRILLIIAKKDNNSFLVETTASKYSTMARQGIKCARYGKNHSKVTAENTCI